MIRVRLTNGSIIEINPDRIESVHPMRRPPASAAIVVELMSGDSYTVELDLVSSDDEEILDAWNALLRADGPLRVEK